MELNVDSTFNCPQFRFKWKTADIVLQNLLDKIYIAVWINLQLSPVLLPFAKMCLYSLKFYLSLTVCTHQLLGGMWNISANVYFTIQQGVVYLKTRLQWISAVNVEVSTIFKKQLWCLSFLSVTAAITIHYPFIVLVPFNVWYGQPLNVSCSFAQSDLWKNFLEV